jgi:hypothetical protein
MLQEWLLYTLDYYTTISACAIVSCTKNSLSTFSTIVYRLFTTRPRYHSTSIGLVSTSSISSARCSSVSSCSTLDNDCSCRYQAINSESYSWVTLLTSRYWRTYSAHCLNVRPVIIYEAFFNQVKLSFLSDIFFTGSVFQ